jgi:hypothetical protein
MGRQHTPAFELSQDQLIDYHEEVDVLANLWGNHALEKKVRLTEDNRRAAIPEQVAAVKEVREQAATEVNE